MIYLGSRSPVRSPPASFYPPLHSMWGFSAHGAPSAPSGVALNGGNHTPTSSKDPVTGFGYPPTPPIDLKSGSDNHQHLQIQPQSHQDYLQQPSELAHSGESGTSAVSAGVLPSLASIETKHNTQYDILLYSFLIRPEGLTVTSCHREPEGAEDLL